jgi:hypothetical protein
MESRILELRALGSRRLRAARRVALFAVGVGAAAVGVFVVWRLARPATARERVQRFLPAGTLKDLRRMRETLELRGRRRVPPIRVSVGDRRAGEEPETAGRWERVAVVAARAAGSAAARAVVSRMLKELRPGPRPR